MQKIPATLLSEFDNFCPREHEQKVPLIGKFFTDGIYLDSNKDFRRQSNYDIIKFYQEQMFIEACASSPLEVIIQMYEISVKLNNPININAVNHKGISAFMNCCKYGRKEVAIWLYNLSKKINTMIDHLLTDDWRKSPFYLVCQSEYADVSMVKWIYELCLELGAPVSIHGPYDNDMLFIFTRDVEISEWLCKMGVMYESPINIHAGNNYAFKLRCAEGNLEGAMWLYNYAKSISSPIDVCDYGEYCGVKVNAFIASCEAGQIHLVRWLMQIAEIDVRINNDAAFKIACMKAGLDGSYQYCMDLDADYLAVVKWLCSKCDKYQFIERNGKVIEYQIKQ